MSSHHIIRDQQEPALYISSLESFPISELHALLEWSPSVFCTEQALGNYLIAGHKVDYALVEPENIHQWDELLKPQYPVSVLFGEQDRFVNISLDTLQKHNHSALNLICADEEIPGLVDLLSNHIQLFYFVFFTPTMKVVFQKHYHFSKWVPSDTTLIVTSLFRDQEFYFNGFSNTEKVDDKSLKLFRSEEGQIAIHCDKTPYLIKEKW